MRTDFVEVEGKFARNGAVETGFEEGGPILREDVLAAVILLADAGHARVNVLAAVDVLDGRFAEEEVHIVSDVVRSHEVGFCSKSVSQSLLGRFFWGKKSFFLCPNSDFKVKVSQNLEFGILQVKVFQFLGQN